MGLVIDERVPYQHVTLNDLSCKYLGVSPGDGVIIHLPHHAMHSLKLVSPSLPCLLPVAIQVLLEYVEDYEFITAVQIAPIIESMKCRSKEQVQRDLEDYIANAKVQLPMYQGTRTTPLPPLLLLLSFCFPTMEIHKNKRHSNLLVSLSLLRPPTHPSYHLAGDVIRVGGVLYKVTELKVDGYEDLKYGEFVATNNAGVNATQLAHQVL